MSLAGRVTFLGLSFLAALAFPASGQEPIKRPPVLPRPEPPRFPMVRDEGGLWSATQRAEMNQAIADIHRRFRCYVYVESYVKAPPDLTAGADLTDVATRARIIQAWANRRFRELWAADRQPGMCVVLVLCWKEGGKYEVRCKVPGSTPAERQLSKGLADGLLKQLGRRLILGMPDGLAFIRDTLRSARSPAAAKVMTPGVRDLVGYWPSEAKTHMDEVVADIHRKFGWSVCIETYNWLPEELAGQDLTNQETKSRLMDKWATSRGRVIAQQQPGTVLLILACRETDCHVVGASAKGPAWTDEQRQFVSRIVLAASRRLPAGKFIQGMPDALAVTQATLARAPTTEPVEAGATTTTPGGAAADADLRAFEREAEQANLSPEDVKAILRVRGNVSYKALTDFIIGEVKEGRRGKDLKDDVDYFIKVYKEKASNR